MLAEPMEPCKVESGLAMSVLAWADKECPRLLLTGGGFNSSHSTKVQGMQTRWC